MITYAAARKYPLNTPVDEVLEFQGELFKFIDTKYPEIPEKTRTSRETTPETDELLGKVITGYGVER